MMTRMITAVALVGALVAPASAAVPSKENLQLYRAVQKSVLNYAWFSIFDNVESQIDDGVVVLHGKVTMPYKKNDLERRVAKVDGVKRVVNKLEVLPVSQFDDRLRVQIARAIYSNPNFRGAYSFANPPIHIVVERGRVTLEGVVNNEVDRMLAMSIATNFVSFDVKNELKTTAEAKAELERL